MAGKERAPIDASTPPGGAPPAGGPGPGAPPIPPRRGRAALALFALVVALGLCGGGGVAGFLLVESSLPAGAADPAGAVEGFLDAVFTEKSATAAAAFVCPDSREDRDLAQLVFEIKTLEARSDNPRISWSYPQPRPSRGKATVTVTLVLTTGDGQRSEQELQLLLVNRRGWWVCGVGGTS